MTKLLTIILSALLITPQPVSQQPVMQDGSQVVFTADLSSLQVKSADRRFDSLVDTWASFMAGSGHDRIVIKSTWFASKAQVVINYDPSLEKEEYEIVMGERCIGVKASDTRGAWWAMQTLTQLFVSHLAMAPSADKPAAQASVVSIPAEVIKDKPYFAYRGAHLDCSRHFWTVDEIKKFIDAMCVHKLCVFHWHLTDDQGWRMEVKKYPLLTTIGAMRKETIVGHGSKTPRVYDGIPYGEGMYYTQDQIREIVAYASARQIDIMPEIEMPGHMVAALAAYPHMGCTGGPYEVWTRWGVSEDVICLGKDESYQFIEDVLAEVCELFPYKYIHIGGDEAPVVRRKSCPHCQAKMKELGLESEVQLQGHLISRVEKFLKTRNREIVGWNEILDAGVSPDAIIMSWQGDGKSGIRAAKQGNRVIMTPGSHFYFDFYQTPDPAANGEPLAIGGCVTLKQVYGYNPYTGLNAEQSKYILGVQANTWTEYMPTFSHVMMMDMPRFASLSEVGWRLDRGPYGNFFSRVKGSMLPVYDYFGFNYAKYEFK